MANHLQQSAEGARTGKIPSFRIGSLVRFDSARVADWLKARSIPGIAAGRLVGP